MNQRLLIAIKAIAITISMVLLKRRQLLTLRKLCINQDKLKTSPLATSLTKNLELWKFGSGIWIQNYSRIGVCLLIVASVKGPVVEKVQIIELE